MDWLLLFRQLLQPEKQNFPLTIHFFPRGSLSSKILIITIKVNQNVAEISTSNSIAEKNIVPIPPRTIKFLFFQALYTTYNNKSNSSTNPIRPKEIHAERNVLWAESSAFPAVIIISAIKIIKILLITFAAVAAGLFLIKKYVSVYFYHKKSQVINIHHRTVKKFDR